MVRGSEFHSFFLVLRNSYFISRLIVNFLSHVSLFFYMHGVSVISNDGRLFKVLVFPSRYVSEAYLDTLAEDFSKLGYPVKLDYRDGKRVLIISDKVVITGE